jgi:hypothetical protein
MNAKAQELTLIDERTQASRLSVSWRHLQELRKKRLIPYIKLGRRVLYSPEAVARALENLTVDSVR